MEVEKIWKEIFKICFSHWSRESNCYDCSLRRKCQQADPTVSETLKAKWRKEDETTNQEAKKE